MSNIKKRVNLIQGKRIVVGDPNKVTKDEILLEEKNGEVSLKDENGTNISGASDVYKIIGYYTLNSNATWLEKYDSVTRLAAFPYRRFHYYTETTLGKTYSYITFTSETEVDMYRIDKGAYSFASLFNYTRQTNHEASAPPSSVPVLASGLKQLLRDQRYSEILGGDYSYEKTLSLEELKAMIKKFMHTFQDISTFKGYDSPIIGVYYEWHVPYDSSVARREEFIVLSEVETSLKIGIDADSYAKQSYVVANSKYGEMVYSAPVDIDSRAQMFNTIPAGEYVGTNCMYVIYDVSTDTFYPGIKY